MLVQDKSLMESHKLESEMLQAMTSMKIDLEAWKWEEEK